MSNAIDEDEFVYLNRLSQSIRNEVIEECAQKIDQMLTVVKKEDEELIRAVADTIRALKDKP